MSGRFGPHAFGFGAPTPLLVAHIALGATLWHKARVPAYLVLDSPPEGPALP